VSEKNYAWWCGLENTTNSTCTTACDLLS